jgi:hypothetical protein
MNTRPPGQPGTFQFGHTTVDAVLDRDKQYHWQAPKSGTWFPATRLAGLIARRFVPDDVPEWVVSCEHPGVCDTAAECDRQATADDRQSRGEDR